MTEKSDINELFDRTNELQSVQIAHDCMLQVLFGQSATISHDWRDFLDSQQMLIEYAIKSYDLGDHQEHTDRLRLFALSRFKALFDDLRSALERRENNKPPPKSV